MWFWDGRCLNFGWRVSMSWLQWLEFQRNVIGLLLVVSMLSQTPAIFWHGDSWCNMNRYYKYSIVSQSTRYPRQRDEQTNKCGRPVLNILLQQRLDLTKYKYNHTDEYGKRAWTQRVYPDQNVRREPTNFSNFRKLHDPFQTSHSSSSKAPRACCAFLSLPSLVISYSDPPGWLRLYLAYWHLISPHSHKVVDYLRLSSSCCVSSAPRASVGTWRI